MHAKLVIAAVAFAAVMVAAIIWIYPPADESRIGVYIPKSSTEAHFVVISCDAYPDGINVRFQWISEPPHPKVHVDHFVTNISQHVVAEPSPQPMVAEIVFETDESTPESFGIIHWDSPWQCDVEAVSVDDIETFRVEPGLIGVLDS